LLLDLNLKDIIKPSSELRHGSVSLLKVYRQYCDCDCHVLG